MSGLRVAVIEGGPSSEAAVSRASAEAVALGLGEVGHDATRIELDSGLVRSLEAGFDVVFPLVHGPLGEDGCLQGLLEVLGARYVGSGVRASAIAADKPTAKVHFRAAGLPVAGDAIVRRGERLSGRAPELREAFGADLVVKPAGGGSAIGVTILRAEASDVDVEAALERALAIDPVALVEPFRVGQEATCGVLEGESGPVALPPTLIVPKRAGFYDFASKYAPGGSAHQCPAPFPEALVREIQDASVAAHVAVGARDLSRTDFIVDAEAGRLTMLEVNTMPGMTATSLFPEAAAAAGIPFSRLCDRLVRRAFDRPVRAGSDEVPMPP